MKAGKRREFANPLAARCSVLFASQVHGQQIRLFSVSRPTNSEFDIQSKEELLKLIKKYAKKRKDLSPEQAWERSVLREQVSADDSKEILTGKKRLLAEKDTFNFSCTACGACCHSAAGTVTVDPHDIFLMSRSPSLSSLYEYNLYADYRRGILAEPRRATKAMRRDGEGSTNKLFALFPNAFSFFTARFHLTDDLESESKTPKAIKQNSGLSPVCMMQTKQLPAEARSQPITGKWLKDYDKYELCHFAYPGFHREGESNFTPLDDLIHLEQRENIDTTKVKKIRCGLGPDHMPMPCAAYPLGELWTTQKRDNKGKASGRKDFFSLEVDACEGIDAKKATPRSVREYNRQLGLDKRGEQWDWFLALNAEFVRRKLDKRLTSCDPTKATRETFLYVIRRLWYDFDSVLRIEELKRKAEERQREFNADRLGDEWNTLKPAIWAKTMDICDLLEKKCDLSLRGEAFVDSFQSFFDNLPTIGIHMEPSGVARDLNELFKKD